MKNRDNIESFRTFNVKSGQFSATELIKTEWKLLDRYVLVTVIGMLFKIGT